MRQNLDSRQFAAETGLRLRPIVLEQHSPAPEDGLLREWPRPDAGIEKHESYSLQWYSLAALAIVLFVAALVPPCRRELSSLLVAAACAAPVVLGTLAYCQAGRRQAGNYGELLAPRTLPGRRSTRCAASGCW